MPKDNINIRYSDSKAEPAKPRGRPPKAKETPVKEDPLAQAKKEALEKARAILRENRKKEREAKKALQKQNRHTDEVILERAKRSHQLRLQQDEHKKRQQELEEQQKLLEEEAMRIAQEEMELEEPDSEPEPEEPEPEPENEESEPEPDIVKRVSKPGRKGRRVLVIDSSIFEDDSGVEIEYKRKPKRVVNKISTKPKPKATKRTRFVEPEYSEEEESEEEEEYQHYPQPVDPDVHNPGEYNTSDGTGHSNQVRKPPPIRRKVVSREEMLQDPLYGLIFN